MIDVYVRVDYFTVKILSKYQFRQPAMHPYQLL